MMAEDTDFLRPLVRAVILEFLEAEMAEAVGAAKGERVEGRLSYRSGYYPRSLIPDTPCSPDPLPEVNQIARTVSFVPVVSLQAQEGRLAEKRNLISGACLPRGDADPADPLNYVISPSALG